ncbi:carbon starvation induced protein CsiD [Klebsiella pneumoniae subsp. pneumoniae]|nr:carbon starvation induced protein CsiD [Klebsiella pneumoniae subsp. pneumoniae]
MNITLTLQRGTIPIERPDRSKTDTRAGSPAIPGFSFTPSAQSPRLLELTFSAETTTQFLQQVAQWPVQALEYKSFLRFQVGKILDDLCGNQLQPLLIKTLLDRAEGCCLSTARGDRSRQPGRGDGQAGHRRRPPDWSFQLRRHERSVLRPLRGEKCR